MTVFTPAQRKRVMKKIRANRGTAHDWPYVRCLGCGWVGFDIEDPRVEHVTPCPSCGHELAEFALDY